MNDAFTPAELTSPYALVTQTVERSPVTGRNRRAAIIQGPSRFHIIQGFNLQTRSCEWSTGIAYRTEADGTETLINASAKDFAKLAKLAGL